MNNKETKKVKFFNDILENETLNNIQSLKGNPIITNKNLSEEEKDEMLLNKKRNFNNNYSNPNLNSLISQNQTGSQNLLEYSDFKNPERIYSYSNNKYSSSTIMKIDDHVIKQTPEKSQNYELNESRYRSSNYKFSSGKKIITSIENPSGIKAFDNSFGLIENYYLEKTAVNDLAFKPENSRCNLKIPQGQKAFNISENEVTPIFGNTKRNLSINDLPNKFINFSESNNNILDLEKIKDNSNYEILMFKDKFFQNKNKYINTDRPKETSPIMGLHKIKEESNSKYSENEEDLEYIIPQENDLDLNENENEIRKFEESEFKKENQKRTFNEENNFQANDESFNLVQTAKPVLLSRNDAVNYGNYDKSPNKFNQVKNSEKLENEFTSNKGEVSEKKNVQINLQKDEELNYLADDYYNFNKINEKINLEENANKAEMDFDSQLEIPKANDFYMQSNSDFPEEEQESEDIGLLKCKQTQSSKSLQETHEQMKESKKSNFAVINLINEENDLITDQNLCENKINDKNNFRSNLSAENEKAKLESKILGLHSNSLNYSKNEYKSFDYEVIESSDNLLNKSFIEESNNENYNINKEKIGEYGEVNIHFENKDKNNNLNIGYRSLQDIMRAPELNEKLEQQMTGKTLNKVSNEVTELIESADEDKEKNREGDLIHLDNDSAKIDKNEEEESVFSNYQLEPVQAAKIKYYPEINNQFNYDQIMQEGFREAQTQQGNNDNMKHKLSNEYINHEVTQQNYYEYPKFEDNHIELPNQESKESSSNYYFKNVYSYKNKTNQESYLNNETNKNNMISMNDEDNYYTHQADRKNLISALEKSNQDYYLNLIQDSNLFVNNFANDNLTNLNNRDNNFYSYNFDDIENGINPLQRFEQYLKINSKLSNNGKRRRRRNWYLFSSNKLHYIEPNDFNVKAKGKNTDAGFRKENNTYDQKREEDEKERRFIKELEEILLDCVISKVMKQNNIDENYIEELDVFKDFYQNQLNFTSIKNLLVEQNLISQSKLEAILQKLNFGSPIYDSRTKELSLKTLLFGTILFFAFFLALRLFGFQLSDFANLVSRIPITKILIIFSATMLIAFLTYSLLKITVEIEKQREKQITIARKSQEIISLYLNKIEEYDFDKFYIENNFLIERIAKRLKISRHYFKKNILSYIKKDNPEYRFISYVDSRGRENAFWRLKNY